MLVQLLDYPYYREYYKMIATDLTKPQAFHSDSKATHQISFTGNQDQDGNTAMSFIIEEARETILEFSKGTVRVL